jgi:hypothetical protein
MSNALYNPHYKKSMVFFMIMYGEVWPHLQGIEFFGEIYAHY